MMVKRIDDRGEAAVFMIFYVEYNWKESGASINRNLLIMLAPVN